MWHVGKAIAPLLCCKKEKRKKSRRAIRIRIFSSGWKGLEKRGRGEGRGKGGVEIEGKSMAEFGEDEGGNWRWGGEKLHAHRDINTHNTQTPTPPLHCSSKTDNPSPISPLPLCAPKLVPMGFCISVLQQWANYNQAPSPN